MKILVVEDEPNNMLLMKIILKKHGHEPVEAFTGEEGIEKASSSKPDLILMDLKLPNIDGFEATRRIREINMGIPIIAVTSYSMNDVEEITKRGFNGLIQKPFNPMRIMDEIKKILEH
ncbi:MAG: response regulator [Candidatus Methanoperedens sp.]|nr:response regulator [Candidatus Methanoperedens sp.]